MMDGDASLKSTSMFVRRAPAESPTDAMSAGSSPSGPKTPKPFLKRGSRVEPSALNRKSPSPSAISSAQSAGQMSPQMSTDNVKSVSKHATPIKFNKLPPRVTQQEGHAVSSWNGEDSIMSPRGNNPNCSPPSFARGSDSLNLTQEPPPPPPLSSAPAAMLDTSIVSTIHMIDNDWAQKRLAAQDDLYEFELLEQELDHGGASIDISAARSNGNRSNETKQPNNPIQPNERAHDEHTKPKAQQLKVSLDNSNYSNDEDALGESVEANFTVHNDRVSGSGMFQSTATTRSSLSTISHSGPINQKVEHSSDKSLHFSTAKVYNDKEEYEMDGRDETECDVDNGASADFNYYNSFKLQNSTFLTAAESPYNSFNGSRGQSDYSQNQNRIPTTPSSNKMTASIVGCDESGTPVIRSRPTPMKQRTPTSTTTLSRTNSMHSNSNTPRSSRADGPSAGVGLKKASSTGHVDPDSLAVKVQELEREIETFKKENAKVKVLKKQHEGALNEVLQQKAEINKWSIEEKQKVQAWKEDQKKSIEKEKRLLAKQVQDFRNRQSGGQESLANIRKDRAEIEALQATIEKNKLDYESLVKKNRGNEHRMQSIIKEQQKGEERLQDQLLSMEQEKIDLWAYLDEAGIKIPFSKMKRNSSAATGGMNSGKGSRPGSGYGASVGGRSSASRRTPSGSTPRARTSLIGHMATSTPSSRHVQSSFVEEVPVEDSAYTPRASSVSGQECFLNAKIAARGSSTLATVQQISRSGSGVDTMDLKYGTKSTVGVGNLMDGDNLAPMFTSSKEDLSFEVHGGDEAETEDEGCENVDAMLNDMTPSARTVMDMMTSEIGSSSLTKSTSLTGSSVHKSFINPSSSLTRSTSLTPSSTSKSPIASAALPSSSSTGVTTPAAPQADSIGANGQRVQCYRNGTVKETFPNGNTVITFVNGDVKQVNVDTGASVYFYAEARTTHTTHKDGSETFEFSNKQIEHHYTDGSKDITFPDGSRKLVHASGSQEDISAS